MEAWFFYCKILRVLIGININKLAIYCLMWSLNIDGYKNNVFFLKLIVISSTI